MKLSVIASFYLLLILCGCNNIPIFQQPTPTFTCLEQSQAFLDQLETLATRWDDTEALANSTSRIALSPVIASLQDIRRQVDDLETPPCSAYLKHYLIQYMDYTIEAFLLFMADEPDYKITEKFEQAIQSYDLYKTEFSKIMGDR